tara:strand:+ start:201 stop:575 length:375 start_codon:yes stop_codon:yes gene_type:complete
MNSIIAIDLNFFTITIFAAVLIWLSEGQKHPRYLLYISGAIMMLNTSALPWHFSGVETSYNSLFYYLGILVALVAYLAYFIDGQDSLLDYKKKEVANEGVRIAYRKLTKEQKESFKAFVNGKSL